MLAPAQRNKMAAALAAFIESFVKENNENAQLEGTFSVVHVAKCTYKFKYILPTSQIHPRTVTFTKPDDMSQEQFDIDALEVQQIVSDVELGVLT